MDKWEVNIEHAMKLTFVDHDRKTLILSQTGDLVG